MPRTTSLLALAAAATLLFAGRGDAAILVNGFAAASSCAVSATAPQLYQLITPRGCDVSQSAVCTNGVKSVCVEESRPTTFTLGGSVGTYLVFSQFQGSACDGGANGAYYQGAAAILSGTCTPLVSDVFGFPGFGKAVCSASGNASLELFWDSACTSRLGSAPSVAISDKCSSVTPIDAAQSFVGSCVKVEASSTVAVPVGAKPSSASTFASSMVAMVAVAILAVLML